MPTYYVGQGGNDGNTGLSWAQRKLTLNGAENIPVIAGDTVYVGAGVYREMLTVDVSGAAGSPITYIGDYTGANTDGVGGVVRITGSDNDQTYARPTVIFAAAARTYRTFRNFYIDGQNTIVMTDCSDWILDGNYVVGYSANGSIRSTGNAQGAGVIRNCYIIGISGIYFDSAVTITASHLVESCIIHGRGSGCWGIGTARIDGITVRNCLIQHADDAVRVTAALAVGNSITVNNCIMQYNTRGVRATVLGEIVGNYNNYWINIANYTNVTAGANDTAYPPLLDTRWFFEAVNGGRMVTPFDLGQWSQLINLAGLNPPATDLRGTGAIGGVREWGPLEYDTTLLTEGGGGAVSISPFRGNIG